MLLTGRSTFDSSQILNEGVRYRIWWTIRPSVGMEGKYIAVERIHMAVEIIVSRKCEYPSA